MNSGNLASKSTGLAGTSSKSLLHCVCMCTRTSVNFQEGVRRSGWRDGGGSTVGTGHASAGRGVSSRAQDYQPIEEWVSMGPIYQYKARGAGSVHAAAYAS